MNRNFAAQDVVDCCLFVPSLLERFCLLARFRELSLLPVWCGLTQKMWLCVVGLNSGNATIAQRTRYISPPAAFLLISCLLYFSSSRMFALVRQMVGQDFVVALLTNAVSES